MKAKLLVVVLSVLAILVLELTLAAEPAKVPAEAVKNPEMIRIDTNKNQKSVPKFTHADHARIVVDKKGLSDEKQGCVSCHHTTRPGDTPQTCVSCHSDVVRTDPKTGACGFKRAFHMQCMYCHIEQRDQPQLRKCVTCHGC